MKYTNLFPDKKIQPFSCLENCPTHTLRAPVYAHIQCYPTPSYMYLKSADEDFIVFICISHNWKKELIFIIGKKS